MAIAFIAATEAGTASASPTQSINVPGGVNDGDFLIAFIATADGDTGSVSLPGAWTGPIVNNVNVGLPCPSPPGLSVYWRIASSEPGSYTITDTESSGIAGQMLAFSGVDPATPIDTVATPAIGSSTNADPPSADHSGAGGEAAVVGAIWDSTSAVYSAVPSGYVSPDTLGDIIGNGGGNGLSLATAYDLTIADPENPPAFTSGTEQWAAATVILRAAPSGGNFDQTSFQGYEDDAGEGSATPKASVDTDWNQRQDENFRIRFLVQEADDVDDPNVEFQLQYNLNAAGWNDVNASSSVVRSSASVNFADGDSCTQQIGAGTFIGSQNGMDEVNGLAGGANLDWTTTPNQETELEFCCQVRGADTVRGDTIQLRLLKEPDIALGTYTNTPTLTVPVGAGMQMATAELFQGTAGTEDPAIFDFQRSLPWGTITLALRAASGASTSNLGIGSKMIEIATPIMTVRDGATIDGLTIDGDVILDDVVDLDDVFITGNLMIGTAGSYDFNDVVVVGDITNSDASGNVAITATGTSSLNTSEPGTGNGEVDIIIGAVTVQVTTTTTSGSAVGSAAVHLRAANGSGPFPYQASISITRSGSVATVTHSSHGMATGDKILVRGANETEYNGVFTITFIDTGSYSYTVSGTPATPATGSPVCTFVVLDGETNGSGILSMSRTFPSGQPVTGWGRKMTSAPYYGEGTLNATISPVTGLDQSLVLTDD